MSDLDQIFMKRALQLAKRGIGLVTPNPMVGCVIVHQNKIIGEGFHHQYGGPHAEVLAVNSVPDKSLLKESTIYVTLEPCSHYGKTPPCADLLVEHDVRRVVVAAGDPNPDVNGRGLNRLKEHGIDVTSGVLEDQSVKLNRRFNTYHQKKRPYVILKWAQTSDGFISRKNFDSKWISGAASRQMVHRWRAEEASILVGKNTVIHDDPQLTTRGWKGTHPIRVVFDPSADLDVNFQVFDGKVQTYYASHLGDQKGNTKPVKLIKESLVESLLDQLIQERIQSVFVEGGAKTLESFIEAGLWDEARVFVSPTEFGEGIKAPEVHQQNLKSQQLVGLDTLYNYENS